MAKQQCVKIMRFGLIGEAPNGDNYRYIVFKDINNDKEADFIVYKKKRPSLWDDIIEMEKGKVLPPYKGYIAKFNGLDIAVLGEESIEEAFRIQKWKLDIQKSITCKEAEQMRQETKGYRTNETTPGAMEIGWREIDKKARMIRFRYYEGKGQFSWSKWYEII